MLLSGCVIVLLSCRVGVLVDVLLRCCGVMLLVCCCVVVVLLLCC